MPYISYEAYMENLEAGKFCVRLTWPIASLGPSDWTPTAKQYTYVYTLYIWGFPTIRGTILGVPIIRTIVYWGLY